MTPTELWIERRVASGEEADLADLPAHVESRAIRAAVLAGLCKTPATSIRISGATINGSLKLDEQAITPSLALTRCVFDSPITMRRAELHTLCLDASRIKGLDAEWSSVTGSVQLRHGFVSTGEVRLVGATIAHLLDCRGGYLSNPGGMALTAGSLRAKSVILYSGFVARGAVAFPAATLEANFNADGALLSDAPNSLVLNLERLETGGYVFLRDAICKGSVRLYLANIGGNVELDRASIEHAGGIALEATGLKAKGSIFLRHGFEARGQVSLDAAYAGSLFDAAGGRFRNRSHVALSARGLTTVRDVRLTTAPSSHGSRPCEIDGQLVLERAQIGSDLDMDGLSVWNDNSRAVLARGAEIKGDWFMRHAQINGELQMIGAQISGRLHLADTFIDNRREFALNAAGLRSSSVFFWDPRERDGRFRCFGKVVLNQAEIHGQLQLGAAICVAPGAIAVDLYRATIRGDLMCSDRFSAVGQVRMMATRIDGNLVANGATIENAGEIALNGERLSVGGYVHLKTYGKGDNEQSFTTRGGVRFYRASMLALECDGAQIQHAGHVALDAYGLVVTGDVHLRRGFVAEGTVRLRSGSIGSHLILSDSELLAPSAPALDANGLSVQGDVLWHQGVARGYVMLVGASCTSLACVGSRFEQRGLRAFVASALTVRSRLILRDSTWTGGVYLPGASVKDDFELRRVRSAAIDVQQMHCGRLDDDLESWPAGQTRLDGFRYDTLVGGSATSAGDRLQWVRRQPSGMFRPEVYDELAKVLRLMGHGDDARKISMAKREASLDQSRRWIWKVPLRVTIGHGYYPWRALGWAMAMVLVGTMVFGAAQRQGLIVRAAGVSAENATAYTFQPFVYSIDTLLPAIDLQQEKYWVPHTVCDWSGVCRGAWVRTYLWIHMGVGWILITLLLSAWTGVIKRD